MMNKCVKSYKAAVLSCIIFTTNLYLDFLHLVFAFVSFIFWTWFRREHKTRIKRSLFILQAHEAIPYMRTFVI